MLAPEHCSMCCYYITGVISFSPLFSLFVTNITSTTIAATAKLSLSSRRQTSENFQRVSKANDFPKLISTVSRRLFNPRLLVLANISDVSMMFDEEDQQG